jgi:RNA polymerase sigma-70 factor, ECF subfamily
MTIVSGFVSLHFKYVQSVDHAEEVVSDVFLKVWKNRHKIEINTNFKAYIYIATKNQVLNYLEKEKRDFESLDDYHPDEELIFQELENHLEVFVNKLPLLVQSHFKLSRIEGFTYREIAEILSISIHTIQNQIVKAVKKLGSYSTAK